MAKAATHSLAQSIKASDAAWDTICILPKVIDTEGNRAAMPSADFSQWTQPSAIADRITGWVCSREGRPVNDLFVEV